MRRVDLFTNGKWFNYTLHQARYGPSTSLVGG
jgi:hypothetical protein